MTDWREDRVGAALAGRNPTVMYKLAEAFAVMGDVQFLPGYSVAITTTPGVDRLSDLPRARRVQFLADTDLLASAVETVCAAHDPSFTRVNVEILGNQDAFLHAHVWPRYGWEDEQYARRPVWLYPPTRWSDPETLLGPQHQQLRSDLTAELTRLAGQERVSSTAPRASRTS